METDYYTYLIISLVVPILWLLSSVNLMAGLCLVDELDFKDGEVDPDVKNLHHLGSATARTLYRLITVEHEVNNASSAPERIVPPLEQSG